MNKPLNFLISSGPTREHIDPVRFITNASSGKMGCMVAEAALAAGHQAKIVTGPVKINYPDRAEVIETISALEMYAAVMQNFPDCDVLVMTAAVCDYRPIKRSIKKIHKSDESFVLRLERNPDILLEVKRVDKNQTIIGFAAETDDLIVSARRKLEKKKMDMIIANEVGGKEYGFAVEHIKAILLFREGVNRELGRCKKNDLAKIIVEEAVKIHEAKVS